MTDQKPGPLRPYRHITGTCSRLLFEAYLPPGAWIRARCPSCGKMHEIRMDSTGVAHLNGHNLTQVTP